MHFCLELHLKVPSETAPAEKVRARSRVFAAYFKRIFFDYLYLLHPNICFEAYLALEADLVLLLFSQSDPGAFDTSVFRSESFLAFLVKANLDRQTTLDLAVEARQLQKVKATNACDQFSVLFRHRVGHGLVTTVLRGLNKFRFVLNHFTNALESV